MRQRILLPFVLCVFQTGILFSQPSVTEEYIKKYSDFAVMEMLIYRIPASVKMAQAILESGSGRSQLALQANNHFGIKCHVEWQGQTFFQDDDEKNECFRSYSSPEESFKDHSQFLVTRPRYASLFSLPMNDYVAWANGLKAAGYATNPRYPELLIRQIERYHLYDLDTITMMPVSFAGAYPVVVVPQPSIKHYRHRHHERVSEENNAPTYERLKDEDVVIRVSDREVRLNNRVKYIVAGANESPEQICADMQIMPWQFYRYNDKHSGTPIIPGEIIYLQPKRRRAAIAYHIVNEGETLLLISQQYGVRLKTLCKLNQLNETSTLESGQKIIMR